LGNARSVPMAELLAVSDFVTLHVPALPDTVNLIGVPELEKMKQGSYLINASRGQVVDIDAAAAALRSGKLNGAAFDVYPYEPAGKDEEFKTPLQGCPNTILTPHIGGSTEEAQYAIGEEVAGKLITYINRGSSLTAINFPEVTLPSNTTTHRVLNIHHNVPGVLRDINNIMASYNVVAQSLMTMGKIGYMMVEVDTLLSEEMKQRISELKTSIRTRILY